MTEREASRRQRVELQLADHPDGSRLHRELGAWARYCVARIEAELGVVERWDVRLSAARDGFVVVVAVQDSTYSCEVSARGLDAPLAIWEAMCHLEQRLREIRARSF
jgi:hypothetical protein